MDRTELQNKFVEDFIGNNFRGAFELPTGFGKTRLAFKIIARILELYNYELNIIISVPTITLRNQWLNLIDVELKDESEKLHNYDFGRNITVECHATTKKRNNPSNDCLLIIDEAHEFLTDNTLHKFAIEKILCLSAYYKKYDYLEECNIPILAKLDFKESVEKKYVGDYVLKKQYVELTPVERDKYNNLSEEIKEIMDSGCSFNTAISILTRNRGANKESFKQARKLMSLINDRKILLQNAENKLRYVIENANFLDNKRTIIFTENIECANNVAVNISKNNIPCSLYHCELSADKRNEHLINFKKGISNIIITPKALNRGLDISNCNCSIIMSYTSSKIDMLQRVGRTLRYEEGKKSIIVILCCANTVEVKWLNESGIK